ncbi:EAL domain-containing protein [Haliea sp. E1-2-M8]|uniref:putative bifunctional diguanylate cyclase/phosphodiesterase n=1 Tax=Haliea sp. E1-2-M8 TaxID=3064706 RepID=UPI002718472D|nr:EAL domain-containing protein [Haliea sp. E1-2-M8]MDO8862605.1 EAL domain-containing protein [Haliea sp. E1-2-M8]
MGQPAVSPGDGRDLSIQAAVVILLICSLLMGLGGLALEMFSHFTVPPWLTLRFEGTIGISLAGACMVAAGFDSRRGRQITGAVLLLFTAYNLGHNLLEPTDTNSLLTGRARLPSVPSALLMMLAISCIAGMHTPRQRLLWNISATFSLLTGVALAVAYLDPSRRWAALASSQFMPLGTVFCIVLASGTLVTGNYPVRPLLRLPPNAILMALMGALLSMSWWFMGSWVQHDERLQAADAVLNNYALTVAHELDSQTKLMRRMSARWEAMGELPSGPLAEEDIGSYFRDVPNMRAFAFLDDRGNSWSRSRDAATERWLATTMATPLVTAWLEDFRNSGESEAWEFPDADRPQLALLGVSPGESAAQRLVTLVDLSILADQELRQNPGEFWLEIVRAGTTIARPGVAAKFPKDNPYINVSSEVILPPGQHELTLVASAGAPRLNTLNGLLPIGGGLFGLLLTYHLVIGRGLLDQLNQQTAALRNSEQRFRSLFSQNPDAVFALNTDGTYASLNPLTQAVLGVGEDDMLGHGFTEVLSEESVSVEDNRKSLAAFSQALDGRPQTIAIAFSLQAQGEPRHFDISLLPIVVDGRVEGVFGIAKDTTQRAADEERLRVLERSLEASSNAVIVVDARRKGYPVVYVNPAFTRILGYPADAALGNDGTVFLTGEYVTQEDRDVITNALENGKSLSLTLRNQRRDGTPFWNQLSFSPVFDAGHEVTHFVGILNDISERKEQESRLAYQATHDALTGLGNRSLFNDRLEHDFSLARRRRNLLAVLFIDLDEFKPINDTLGHKVGDQLLVSVTARLGATLRPSDTLARLGGDEFVLLLPDLNTGDEAQDVAERLLAELARPHRVAGQELHISASIGIAVITADMRDPEKLVQQADIAMYQAKQAGRNTYQVFTGDMDQRLSERLTMRNELQEAMDSDQLEVYYQPLLNGAGHLEGLEALLRWHPRGGDAVSPSVFIPLAEETGQIIQLSRWVLERACRDAGALQQQGLLQGKLAVNVSPMQFHRESFMPVLESVLRQTGFAPRHLELELTEGVLMRDTDGAIAILEALAALGVDTVIDDFGTGFSSLSYIRTLPVHKIKIDGSFVRGVIDNAKDAAVCKGVIALARELDLRVVAEGVETSAQYAYLKRHGCEVFQGYLFARPMPLAAVTLWLRERTARFG